MAATILEQLDGVEVSLERGEGGIFDVSVDEQVVFSKHALHLSKIDDVKPEDVIKKI